MAAGGCARRRKFCTSRCRNSVTKPARCGTGISMSCLSSSLSPVTSPTALGNTRSRIGGRELPSTLAARCQFAFRMVACPVPLAITSASAASAAEGSSGIRPWALMFAVAASDDAMPP
ncbi:Uncharacterised protein [Mycobacteroides abscessus subsp. abscessus]|nr:Uncharacterised protein [Mycobacteroides abscessus subsp. abscessus]